METLLIQLTHLKAAGLLQKLEELHLIQVLFDSIHNSITYICIVKSNKQINIEFHNEYYKPA